MAVTQVTQNFISTDQGQSTMVTQKNQKLIKRVVEDLNEAGYYRDSELPGFCLRVCVGQKTGKISKYYLVNAKCKGTGKTVTVNIGRTTLKSAEQARIAAKNILAQLANGINPNTETRQRKIALKESAAVAQQAEELEQTTLLTVLNSYLSSRRLGERTSLDYARLLKRCCSDWLTIPINEITRNMVQEKHLELSKEHPAQANYTMRVVRALFKYAMAVYETTDGAPLLQLNPVDRLKHARLWNRIPRRQTLIRPHQLADWYKGVCALDNKTARDMLLLELFTGARHSEAAKLEWSNVDFKADTILFADTKNHEDHLFPLSSQLKQILLARQSEAKESPYVFPSITSKDRYMNDLREHIKTVIDVSGVQFTEHDLRRTFETTAESLDISYYTLKKLLNHKTGSDPTAGYIITSAERLRNASQRIADTLSSYMQLTDSQKKANSRAKKFANT